jgi:alpha-L-rhamnosidase
MLKNIFSGLLVILLLPFFQVNAQTLLSHELQNASWIGDAKQSPASDSLFYQDDPAPLFRKSFVSNKAVKSARLFITAAGYYSASINGKNLNQNYLDPAWTDYKKRIYYSEYDVKDMLVSGKNAIGVTLGNGFYNPLPLKMWGHLNLRDHLPTGRPVFISRIRIEFNDGTVQEILSDNTWKYSYGPVMKNNVYLGEKYDANYEIKNWNYAEFDDKDWNNTLVKDGPDGKLIKTFFPHIQQINVYKPVKISRLPNGKIIVDMGVNFTGTFKIRLHGKRGDTIQFRFGERNYPNGELNPMTAVAGQVKSKGIGGAGAPDIAEQGGMYIFGDNTEVWYSPVFSFRVFRYMEISGLKYQPKNTDIEGIALSTNVLGKNSFSCYSKLVNSIQEITTRAFISNLMSVQSDCPGRERFSYGGDLYNIGESFILNYNMQSFYRKTLYDWIDAVTDSVFIDCAPNVGLKYCGINFEASILELQDKLLTYYGDTAIIREMYDFDLKWMEKAAKMFPSGIVEKGLGDHEALVNVPVQLIGTAAYLNSARIMVRISGFMGDQKNKQRFIELESKIKRNLIEMYWSTNSFDLINRQSREASLLYINTLPDKERIEATVKLNNSKELFNKQTLYAVFLCFDVLPEKDRKSALDSLLKAIDCAPAGHFTVGIFGLKYIFEALSKYGYANKVFEIVNSTAFPGWGFMVNNGATTLWETWKESDDIYSNCHGMFGSVSGWFYRWIGGIRPMAAYPGFKKFTIAPTVPNELSYSKCSYESPLGMIISNWEKTGKKYTFHVTVPEGATANFELPFRNPRQILVKRSMDNTTFSPVIQSNGICIFELKSGQYEIISNQ